MGVRPSLDCCAVDAEKVRRAADALAASAGTRKDGRVAIGAEQRAALDRLGASIVGVIEESVLLQPRCARSTAVARQVG